MNNEDIQEVKIQDECSAWLIATCGMQSGSLSPHKTGLSKRGEPLRAVTPTCFQSRKANFGRQCSDPTCSRSLSLYGSKSLCWHALNLFSLLFIILKLFSSPFSKAWMFLPSASQPVCPQHSWEKRSRSCHRQTEDTKGDSGWGIHLPGDGSTWVTSAFVVKVSGC